MIQFILVLLGLAFGNQNSDSSNHNGQVTTQVANPGGGTDSGDGPGGSGPVSGNTSQLPPPFTNP